MYAEYIDRAYQRECDGPEATIRCEFCGGATPSSMTTVLDNLDACPICDAVEKAKLRALHSDLNRIFLVALSEQPYTEQNGQRWHGRPSLETVAELIRAAVTTAVNA